MSQAQLETQIQRKRTELDILTKDQTTLESAKHDLSEEYKERNENYERLRERLEQANQEVDQSEREILQLKAELVAMRNQGNDGAAENEEIDAKVRSKLSELSPQDCLDQLMKEMSKTAQIMKDPSSARGGSGSGGDPAVGRPGSGGGGSGGGEPVGGASDTPSGLTQVAIHFERIQEFASFQLTSRYTFSQLCDDACRYWGVDPQHGTLRDAHNVMWPPQAVISRHLAERLELDGHRPVVRLVSRQQGAASGRAGVSAVADGDVGGGRGLRERNTSKRGGAVDKAVLEDHKWVLDSEDEDSDEDDSLALIKEWRRMVNEEMSPFFHLPRYAGKRSKFRSLNSNSSSAKQLSEKCATWCKLLMHAVFVFLVTLTLFYRRRVVTSYDAAHSLESSLIHQPFDSGLNFTAAPLALDFEHMNSVDDFWAWMDGPMLNTILPQLDASGRLLVPGERDFSLRQNKMMGGVRMRQYRAGSTLKTGGCVKSTVVLSDGVQVGNAGVMRGRECFAEYSMDRQRLYVASLSTASFGKGGELGKEGFTHAIGNTLNARPVITHTSYYDRSSFAVELPADRGRALQMIWALRDSIWIDRSTRAVILDFNVLNLNYYTMTTCTLVVDFTPGGSITTFHTFNTVTLSMYQFGIGQSFWILVVGDLIVFAFIMYFILWEVLSGIILYGFSTFMSCLWNIVLVMLVLGEISHLVLMLIYETNYVTRVNPALPHYVTHQDLVAMYNTVNNLNSVVLILAFLSTFRLVQDNESFSKVWQTLHLSMGTLGAYFFVYFVVMGAFLIAGHFAFGVEIEGWNTLVGSFNQLLAMLSHSPSKSLAKMMEVDPITGPMFFTLYVFVLLFLMTSVFVAILNDAYSEANKFIVDSESTYWRDVFLAPFRVARQIMSGGDAAIARKAIKGGKKKKRKKKKKV